MKKFLRKYFLFLLPVLLIPALNRYLDPFDYYGSSFKASFDRIHRTRTFNVADWTLAELSKIPIWKKQAATILTIGDSRGQTLITKGFDKGWKSRTFSHKGESIYDLSFGGAQLVEMKSLLEQELVKCPKVKTVIFVLALDRLIEHPHAENRIKASAFNSKFPNLTYLINPNNILTFVKASQQKTSAEMNESDRAAAKNKIGKDMVEKFGLGTVKNYEEYLSQFNAFVKDLKAKKIRVILLLPPYEPQYYSSLIQNHKDLYLHAVQGLERLKIETHNLQAMADYFDYQDPVHGLYQKGSILSILNL